MSDNPFHSVYPTTLLCKVAWRRAEWYRAVYQLMLRTSRQRKVLCRECPVARAADLVGDSVSLLMLRDLLIHPSRRFTDFELALAGVSSRTIAIKLKKLEACGFITRAANKHSLPRADYLLTPKGRALKGVIGAMRSYGKKYL